MNRLTAFLFRRVTSARFDARSAQLFLSVAAVMFLVLSVWKLVSLDLPDGQFLLGLLLSLAVTLLLTLAGLVAGTRANAGSRAA